MSNLTYSIIIPNYNGARFLGGCLDSIKAQTLQPLETIVVDDASTDDSVKLVRENYPWVKLLVRAQNGAFAKACNDGFEAANGDIIVLFNNDAEAEPEWLEAIDRAFQSRPEISSVASRIMLYDRRNVFHTAGDYYKANGIPGNRGVWQEDKGQYSQVEEVFGPCGCAAAYRREALDDVRADNPDGKVLDESLVMYCEDVDLNVRLRLRNHRCLYQPEAVVYHRLSATGGGTLASYRNGRNFIVVALKDLPREVLLPNLPALIWTQLAYAFKSLRLIRLKTERARLKGQLDALLSLPDTLKRRKLVQSHRTVRPELFSDLLKLNQN
ncbi:MAG TPA: glycosyltransferase family 2 protein [Chloroflexia bacterium]|nr:glycosyltransferase family 2 protein [Chloroflexia bacterium]